MATRKKKTEEQIVKEVAKLIAEETLQATDTPKKKPRKSKEIISSDIAEMSVMVSDTWPKVVQGSHLTVITHEDGHTELKWDDDALLADVREALSTVEVKNPKRKKKAAE
jgi:hypothetical protein